MILRAHSGQNPGATSIEKKEEHTIAQGSCPPVTGEDGAHGAHAPRHDVGITVRQGATELRSEQEQLTYVLMNKHRLTGSHAIHAFIQYIIHVQRGSAHATPYQVLRRNPTVVANHAKMVAKQVEAVDALPVIRVRAASTE